MLKFSETRYFTISLYFRAINPHMTIYQVNDHYY